MEKIIALLFIVFIATDNIYCQTDTITMNEILVISSKTGNQSNINGKTIEIENPVDGGAVFKNQVGFSIEKRGNYGMEPVLRGFKYTQLNIIIDGGTRSSNACPNRMDPAISQIAPEEIEKIEVIKGPYDVRFGQAMGGTVNVISKRPQKTDKTVKGNVEGGYQSNGGNYFSNAFIQLVGNKVDLSLNGGYKDFGNYESGNDADGKIEVPSSFTRYGYSAKLGINPNSKQRIQLSARQTIAKDILYAGLPMDAIEDNSIMTAADYAITDITTSIFSMKFKAYYSYVDHLMTNELRPNYKFAHSYTPVEATSYGARAEIGIMPNNRNTLFAGLDYNHIGKDGHRDREVFINACTGDTLPQPKNFVDKVWQDSKKDDIGVFIQNDFNINNSFLWRVGLRLDYITYRINDPENDFKEHYNNDIQSDSRLNPNISTSLTYTINNSFNIQLATAVAYRSPDLAELYINHLSIGMDAYEYLGNPNLKSERNIQTDIKIEKNWNGLTIYGDLFYSNLNNYISAKVDSTIPRKFLPCNEPKFTKVFTNVERAYILGFEIGGDIKFAKYFTYALGGAYNYAQNISWNEPLAEIPPFTMNTFIQFENNKINTKIHARIASKQDRVSATFDETASESFSVFDFYFQYSPWKFMELNFAITNIFDTKYVEHLSRAYKNQGSNSGIQFYEPGRSINMGLKFNF